jgi:hypothetical protein
LPLRRRTWLQLYLLHTIFSVLRLFQFSWSMVYGLWFILAISVGAWFSSRVPGYRPRDPRSISDVTRFYEKWWVWNGVHSASWVKLRSYLEKIVAAPVETAENTTVGIRCAEHATPSIRKSSLTCAKSLTQKRNQLHRFSPRARYTDRATATCRWS